MVNFKKSFIIERVLKLNYSVIEAYGVGLRVA